MTNKEHLATLSAEACASLIMWVMHEYITRFTDSYVALEEWLGNEYGPVKPAGIEGLEFCPVCWHHLNKEDSVCNCCFTDIDWRKE